MFVWNTKGMREHLKTMHNIKLKAEDYAVWWNGALTSIPLSILVMLVTHTAEMSEEAPWLMYSIDILCAAWISWGVVSLILIHRKHMPRTKQAYTELLHAYVEEVAAILETSTKSQVKYWIIDHGMITTSSLYEYDTVSIPARFELKKQGEAPEYYDIDNRYSIDANGNGIKLIKQRCYPIQGEIKTESGVIHREVYYVPKWYRNVAQQVEETGLGQ